MASFPNLQSQIYTVCEVPPAGWHTTNPMAINPTYGKPCFTVNLNPGQTISVLFGNSKYASRPITHYLTKAARSTKAEPLFYFTAPLGCASWLTQAD